MQPHLLLGQGGGNALYLVDAAAADDAGTVFDILATTNRVAPAGAGGDVLFRTLWVAVTYTMAVILKFTPILDGAALESQTVTLAVQSVRKVQRFRLGLSKKNLDTYGVEVSRTGARGAFLQVKVETSGGCAAGDLIVDGLEVERRILKGAYQKAEVLP